MCENLDATATGLRGSHSLFQFLFSCTDSLGLTANQSDFSHREGSVWSQFYKLNRPALWDTLQQIQPQTLDSPNSVPQLSCVLGLFMLVAMLI